jgi:hypothetical protein
MVLPTAEHDRLSQLTRLQNAFRKRHACGI